MSQTKFLLFTEIALVCQVSFTVCVNNCTGHFPGNYQSCYTCYGYVAWIDDNNLKNMTCQEGEGDILLLWDNMEGRCERTSPTCHQAYI